MRTFPAVYGGRGRRPLRRCSAIPTFAADCYGTNDHWENPGDFDPGWRYSIVLGGADFAVPEPATAALFGLGVLALFRRRR